MCRAGGMSGDFDILTNADMPCTSYAMSAGLPPVFAVTAITYLPLVRASAAAESFLATVSAS